MTTCQAGLLGILSVATSGLALCRTPFSFSPPPLSYALSFSPDFFCGGDPKATEPSPRPTSVCQAIASMSRETWDEMAHEVFRMKPGDLDCGTVLDKVRETNTCANLDSPVQVWIDEQGRYDVLVYDAQSASSRKASPSP